jgi:hypothetical protein
MGKAQNGASLPISPLGIPLELHPILRNSIADLVVKQSQYDAPTGAFTIPPRTTAVFLER